MTERADIKSMTPEELTALITGGGFPKFRAKQVADWLKKGAASAEEMKNLPADLKKFIQNYCYISVAIIEKKFVSRYDKTVKYLFAFADGECVESVVMRYRHGYSICISTQVGCRMGCKFCASTLEGCVRSLSAGEMLGEILAANRFLAEGKQNAESPGETEENSTADRVSHVVLMGSGEPLAYFENVVRFIRLVSSEQSLNIGTRHITLSTCGIVPKIYELAKYRFQINLAVSLHAPNDELRSRTMPIARAYPMEQLLRACADYFEATGRRVTYEYALISGVNDSDECARELAQKLSGTHSHVNLIPVNAVEGTGFNKSSIKRQQSFADILAGRGIAATVRRTLGSDINASCGQLRRKHIDSINEDL